VNDDEALVAALGRHDAVASGLFLCHFFRMALIERSPGQPFGFARAGVFV